MAVTNLNHLTGHDLWDQTSRLPTAPPPGSLNPDVEASRGCPSTFDFAVREGFFMRS
jgi:hypothetical protein